VRYRGDASVTQHLDERAELAVPWLSVRPAPIMVAMFSSLRSLVFSASSLASSASTAEERSSTVTRYRRAVTTSGGIGTST
jgi:hypothetical protein